MDFFFLILFKAGLHLTRMKKQSVRYVPVPVYEETYLLKYYLTLIPYLNNFLNRKFYDFAFIWHLTWIRLTLCASVLLIFMHKYLKSLTRASWICTVPHSTIYRYASLIDVYLVSFCMMLSFSSVQLDKNLDIFELFRKFRMSWLYCRHAFAVAVTRQRCCF